MPPVPSFLAIHGFTSGGAMSREPYVAALNSGGSNMAQPTALGFGWRHMPRKTAANGTNVYIRQRTLGEVLPTAARVSGHMILWIASLPSAPQTFFGYLTQAGQGLALTVDNTGQAVIRTTTASTQAARIGTTLAAGTFYRVELLADWTVGGAGRASGLGMFAARMTPGDSATPWQFGSLGPTANTAAPYFIEWQSGAMLNLAATGWMGISDLILADATTWLGQWDVHTFYPNPSFAAPSVFGGVLATHKEAQVNDGHPTMRAGSWNDGTDYMHTIGVASRVQHLALTTSPIPSAHRIWAMRSIDRSSFPSVADGASFVRYQVGYRSSALATWTIGTVDASTAANSNFGVPGLASSATNYSNRMHYGPPGIPSADAPIDPLDLMGYYVGPPGASTRITWTGFALYAAVERRVGVNASDANTLATELASVNAGVSATDVAGVDTFTLSEGAASLGISATRSDAYTFSEALGSFTAAATRTDSGTTTDANAGLALAGPADSFTFSEALGSFTAAATRTDTMAASDYRATLAATLQATDPGALTEGAPSIGATLSASDTMTTTDARATLLWAATVTDAYTFTDSLATLVASGNLSDSAALTDARATLVASGNLSDTMSASDARATLTATLQATDPGTFTESASVAALVSATDAAASDLFTFSETVGGLALTGPADAYTFSEGGPSLAATGALTDSGALTDARATLAAAGTLADALTLTDALATLTAAGTLADVATMADTNAGLALAGLTDSAALTDTTAALLASGNVSDSAALSEHPQPTTTSWDFSTVQDFTAAGNASVVRSGSAFVSAATSLAVWSASTGGDSYAIKVAASQVPAGAQLVLQGWMFHPTGASVRMPILQHWDLDFSGLGGIDANMYVAPSGWSHFTQRGQVAAASTTSRRNVAIIMRPLYNPAGAGWAIDAPAFYDDLVLSVGVPINATGALTDPLTLTDSTATLAAAGTLSDTFTASDYVGTLVANLAATDLAASDLFTFTDARATLTAAVAGADTHTGTDSTSALSAALTGNDSAAAIEAVLGIALPGTDSGAVADAASLVAQFTRTDAGTAADATLSLAAALSVIDSALAGEQAALAAALTRTDTAAVAESIQTLAALVAVADAGSLAESGQVTVTVTAPPDTHLVVQLRVNLPAEHHRAALAHLLTRAGLTDVQVRVARQDPQLPAALTDDMLRADTMGEADA